MTHMLSSVRSFLYLSLSLSSGKSSVSCAVQLLYDTWLIVAVRPRLATPAVPPLAKSSPIPSEAPVLSSIGESAPPNRPQGVGLSVVILTLDEEINIQACIKSLRGIDDIHVLDSGSSDRTCELAREAGAKVSVNAFESFGKQRNWAIDNMPLENEWVLHLDADERMTPELLEEIQALVEKEPEEAGFFVPSKLMFMGRWLRHAGGYPTYQVRLFHTGRLRFTDYGHGQREETDGEVGTLSQPYLHDAFSKGLDDWLGKHNRYSRQEAEQAIREKAEGLRVGDLFSSDSVARRRMM